jgi:hypothetical protein
MCWLNRSGALKLFVAALCLLSAASAGTAWTSAAAACAGQKAMQRSPRQQPPPRVGTIKDYPATGLMTGCGNLYSYPAKRAVGASPESYIFLSRAEGQGAWMNLDGRDVRLVLLKTTVWYEGENIKRSRFDYRAKAARISVFFKPPQKENPDIVEMTIMVQAGGTTRIYKAEGSSDC